MLARLFTVAMLLAMVGCASTAGLVALDAGTELRDCPDCPQLVVLPAGSFLLGSPAGEVGRLEHEGPQQQVSIVAPFAMGKYEVTFAEWDACVAAGGCNYLPSDAGWGRGAQPVINLNMDQMNAYLHWLTVRTGFLYRLPTEAEWEYAARAGAATAYSWGDEPDHNLANYGAEACCTGAAAGRDQWVDRAAPVGQFAANAFGLHDMHGNVYERVSDCWVANYTTAPLDGSAQSKGDCRAPGLRGGSWISSPALIRAAERDAYNGYYQSAVMGFRVVRELRSRY